MLHYDLLKASEPVKHIEKDILSDKLSNSYMISSPDELSLNTVMKIIAMKLMCKSGGCGACDICKMIKNNNMADVYTLDKPKYTVEDIRDLIYDTMLKSNYYGYKVYIINGSERLPVIPQNKLLKIIEEPPLNCIFLIGVANDMQILTTLKSRCIKLSLQKFDKATVKSEMINLYNDPIKAEIAASSCQGLLSNADRIMKDDEFVNKYTEIISILKSIKKSGDIVDYLNNPVFSKENISSTFDIIEMIIRDIMVIVNNEPSLINNISHIDELLFLSQSFSKEAVILTLSSIYEVREKLQFNCNATSVADSFLLKMLEVKYLCRI